MKTHTNRSFWTVWGIAFLLFALSVRPTSVYAAVSAYAKIEGESFSENDSKGVSTTWENDPSIIALGWIQSGDYACYKNVNFTQGVSGCVIRYSKKAFPSVEVKIVLDHVDNGTLLVDTGFSTATGQNWTDYETKTIKFKKTVSGVHDVYFKFSSVDPSTVLLHIDYFQFLPDKDVQDTRFLPPVGLKLKNSKGVTFQVLEGQKTVQVVEIPKDMQLFDTEETLSLVGTYEGGKVTVDMKVTKIA
ncbi:MAG: carbohydrate-binding protein, partial [Blautia sp.]|nr:carbohydrate-binding protein [Blautia sp.]